MRIKELIKLVRNYALLFFSKCFLVKQVCTERRRRVFIKVWHSVWLEENYAKPGEPIIEKHSRYDALSTDLLVTLLMVFPVGTLRIIRYNSAVGLPVLDDFEVKEGMWEDGSVVEVTLLTVSKRFRKRYGELSSVPFMVLLRALYRNVKRMGVRGLLIAADKRLFIHLTRYLKFPFVQIGPERFYEGSVTVPAYMSMEDIEATLTRDNPSLADFIFSS